MRRRAAWRRKTGRKPAVTSLGSARKPGRPSPYVSFHADGTGGLLFDARTQKIFRLDRAAAFLWCSLAEDVAAVELARDYAQRAGIGLDDAMTHLSGLIDRWRADGLLANGAARTVSPLPGPRRRRPDALPRNAVPRGSGVVGCRVLDSDIAVRFADTGLARLCAPLLDGLAPAPPYRWTASIDIRRTVRGAALRAAGRPWIEVSPAREIAPALLAAIVRLALGQSTRYPAIHAAMVRLPAGAVLLPAASEHGKSTLAAGLQAAGHAALCDDTVVLDRATMAARPVLPWICVKAGAWRTVGARLPALWRRPAWRRPDGKHVRYLPAGIRQSHRPAPDEPVRAIVFARYAPGRETTWRPLSTAEALDRLLPCLDPIGNRFAADDVDRLVAWTGALPCYELRHASLADGVEAVTEIAA